MDIEVIPCLSFKPDFIVCYSKLDNYSKRNSSTPKFNKREKKGLSNKSSKRIKEVIQWMYFISKPKTVFHLETQKYYKFKLNFITLTLSQTQIHDDKYIIKNLLEPFLRRLRLQFKGVMYVWKAEVQDNGNLHFHLNTNIYIHWETLRNLWNSIQEKHGYIDKLNNPNPNSTDVKAVLNKTNLGVYMSKYLSKGDVYKKPLLRYFRRYKTQLSMTEGYCKIPKNFHQNIKRKINIKLWDSSKVLKSIKINHEGIDSADSKELQVLTQMSARIDLDFGTLYTNINYKKHFNLNLSKYVYESAKNAITLEKESVKYIEI